MINNKTAIKRLKSLLDGTITESMTEAIIYALKILETYPDEKSSISAEWEEVYYSRNRKAIRCSNCHAEYSDTKYEGLTDWIIANLDCCPYCKTKIKRVI